MKGYIIYLNLLLAILLSACSDDFLEERKPSSEETAVQFSTEYAFSWSASTRAVDISIPEKQKFDDGDVIHIQGDFETGEGTVRRYDTFKYANGKWMSNSENGDTKLRWPWNATKATFTAYFVAGTNASLPENGGSFEGDLGGNHLLNDPLKAIAEDVQYGYAVNFQFEHLCTRLVILNTKNNYAEEYWFGRKEPIISNAYRLTYDPGSMEGLGFSFVSNEEKNQGTVSSAKVMSGETGTGANAGYVVFYLEPGKYKGSELNYNGNRLYLSLNVDALDTPTEAETDGLVAGHTYILDIEKASGVIDKEASEDPWVNPEPPVTDFDAQEFLDAIAAGKEYKDILKHDNAGNLVLMKNLDFANQTYIPKSLPVNISFDGNYKYITNANHSLFENCAGYLRNLEIRNSKINSLVEEEAYHVGALVCKNSGHIDNVRLRDLTISVQGLMGTDRTMFVGGLIGEHNNGILTNIYVIGKHSIEVKDPTGGSIDGRMLLGGIVGQASGLSLINNVFMLQDEQGNDPDITIKLNSVGSSTAGVGGIVGSSSVSLENCTYSATIDCSESTVLSCGVGGILGFEISREENVAIRNCNVSGKVYGPFCKNVSYSGIITEGRCNVGGIGGSVQGQNVTISECRSFCDIYDYFSNGNPYDTNGLTTEIFATGAAFGRFTSGNASTQVQLCTAWGKVNARNITDRTYVGSFIGYTKTEFTLGTNTVNVNVNGALPQCGGTFDGAD